MAKPGKTKTSAANIKDIIPDMTLIALKPLERPLLPIREIDLIAEKKMPNDSRMTSVEMPQLGKISTRTPNTIDNKPVAISKARNQPGCFNRFKKLQPPVVA